MKRRRTDIVFPESSNEGIWRSLYEAAERIADLRPWTWMEETDLFGVELPGTGHVCYVSVMGLLGQHLAISAYLDAEALVTLQEISEGPQASDSTERIMEMRQIMASFEDRDMLEKSDRDIIRALGYTFRGRQSWPLFRSYRPGYFPYRLESEEIVALTIVLEQTANVAPRFKEDPSLLMRIDEEEFLVRMPEQNKDGLAWREEIRRLPALRPAGPRPSLDPVSIERYRRIRRGNIPLEVDLFLMPGKIGKPSERLRTAYMLLAVEPASFFIVGIELLMATEGIPAMLAHIPSALVSLLEKADVRPFELRVRSKRLYGVLKPCAEVFEADIKLYDDLPAAEEAKQGMNNYVEK